MVMLFHLVVLFINYIHFYFHLGNGNESKLNTALLKDHSEVLRYYVKHVAERELQLLFRGKAPAEQKGKAFTLR